MFEVLNEYEEVELNEMEDFNVTFNAKEHSAGSAHMLNDMVDFNDCVNQIEVDDLCCSGLYFTWTKNIHKVKKVNVTGILKKLHRVMVNDEFITTHPSAHDIFIPYLISDHRFTYNLEKEWNIDVNGNLVDNVKKIQSDLKNIQIAIDSNPFNKSIIKIECILLKSYLDVVSDKEKLLYQKSKIRWLSYGDNNNALFHKVLKGKYQRSRIHSIHDEGGHRYEGEQVASQFVNHFTQFLSVNPMVVPISNGEVMFTKKLFNDEANYMIRVVNDKEIKDAMFSIGDNKALGPDSFSVKFFKKAWHIVGKDVCRVVKEFFSNGQLL
ncbi:hypothetical protein Tco_1258390 [Tanacetum coccineum]